jgi:hypothetical protein
MDNIWDTLVDMKPIIMLAVSVGVAVLIFGYALSDHLEWRLRRMKFFGLFYKLGLRDQAWLSAGFLRLLFAIAIVCFAVRMGTIHTVFYIVASAAYVALSRGFKSCFVEIVNSVAVYAALTVLNIIFGYYRDVNGDPYFMAVYCLLGLFVALYLLYFYIRGIGDLLIRKIITFDPKENE